MAPDDRDRNFEKALARHLRSSSAPGTGAAAASAPACPDPEILAAYHEHSLPSTELTSWKEHVLACARCQSILAELSATDHLILEPSGLQDPLLATQPVSSEKVRSSNSREEKRGRHSPSWRWILLIPAGAIAAVLVAYIAIHEQPPPPLNPTSSVEVAENRAAPPPESASKPAPAEPATRDGKDQAAANATPAPSPPAPNPANKTQINERKREQENSKFAQQSPAQTASGVGSGAGNGPSVSLQKQQQDQQLAAGARRISMLPPREEAKKLDNKEQAAVPRADATTAPPVQPPPPPALTQEQPGFVAGGSISAQARQKAAPPASSSASAAKEKAQSADAISSITESVEVSAEPQAGSVSSANSRATFRAAALANPHVFAAPDGKHFWRLGSAGSIEYSSNRGVKWTPQSSGVATNLVAASAPEAKVCWVVGTAGTILRTTDGGSHWLTLVSPISGDLAGVHANDALHARVWFLADSQSHLTKAYETSDGGLTWTLAPSD